MAAKYCAQCGAGLGPVDKFCALCGTKVISACPTCGQDWDGVSVASSETTHLTVVTPSVKESSKVKEDPIAELTPLASVSGLIYGPEYDPAKDCANCGMAGKKKACNSCGSGFTDDH